MAKRHHRRRRHTSRRRHGGAGAPSPASYSSAASFGAAVNGSGDSQYSRVFSQSSPFPPNGNAIIGMQGQRAGSRRRRHSRRSHRHRTYKGGFMGTLTKALVPLGLIGMQQLFSRRHRRK